MANIKFLTKTNKIFLSVIFLIALSVGSILAYFVFSPNVSIKNEKAVYLYIDKYDTFDEVTLKLDQMGVIKNFRSFEYLSHVLKYPQYIKSGRYKITNNMSNLSLIRQLQRGFQAPVKVTFNNIRTKEQLAQRLNEQLMLDSLEMITLLNDTTMLNRYDLTPETAAVVFLPNTYELYWNITPTALFERMRTEYDRYWNLSRREKAAEIGLTPVEVSILASIVEEETNLSAEKPTVAGLYINRLKKRMLLQADPTVKFAVGDFTITRVLNKHLKVNSPYNTYMYRGLPPGPIRIPSISTIEAVLNYERHNYLYMCAKDDLSGYHAFAVTHREHERNAAKYWQALNKRKIFR